MSSTIEAQPIGGSVDSTVKQHSAFGPGQPDMWFLVLFDSLVYACYLISYVVFRMRDPEQFLESQRHLNQGLGVLNTILLLTSSVLVARCVQSTRKGDYGQARREVALAALFGLSFMAVKIYEWTAAIDAGFTLTHSLFFGYYYFITGFHMIHMVIGMVVLFIANYNLNRPGESTLYTVETCGTYWHMVDFLWVFIFSLLYVMR